MVYNPLMDTEDASVPQKIMELLITALGKEARFADVKRLYENRNALLVLDLQDDRYPPHHDLS